MPMIVVIRVPFDVQRVSPNQRLHRHERARRVRAARAAALIAWRQAGFPRMAGPAVVSVVIRRGRPLDHDNAVACLKPLLDQLLCARANGGEGILEDDRPAVMTLGEVRQETGGKWRHLPEVEVQVEARS